MFKRFFRTAFTIILIILVAKGSYFEYAHAITTNVRVGFCAYMPPYQYIDSDNKPTGFHIDLIEEVAKKIDLNLQYIPFGTTSEAMDSLEAGDVDIVLGVVKNEGSDYSAMYSNPLSATNLCLVAGKKDAEQYEKNPKKSGYVAAEFGLIKYKYLSNIGNGITILTANQESGIKLLLSERADMFVGAKECILWYLNQEKRDNDYIIINNYLASAEFCVAVRNGDRYLQHGIDETLSDIRTSELYDSLYNKWFELYTVDYRNLFRIAIVVLAGVFSVMAVYAIISNRRRTAHIESERKMLYSIIEASPAAMVLIDKNQVIEYMNGKAMSIAGIEGYDNGTLLKNLKIFREILEKIDGTLFEHEMKCSAGTIDYYPNNGKLQDEKYRYNIQKMFSYGNQTKALLTVENITSEDREREAVFEKEKNETLNSIIAGIAHEIKNPLTTIKASATMMEKKGDNKKFREAFADYVPQEIERITRLIDNLQNYARPSVSKMEKVNLAEVVQSIYELVRVTAKNVNITMEIGKTEELCLLCDKDKIKQILLNLMINSIEATKYMMTEDKQVHNIKIEAFAEKDCIFIKVSDDGIGMTPEELESCTMPFYTTKPAGTGIGLALVKQYIEEVGGRISVNSQKRQFTCVEIQLPKLNDEEKV